MSSPVFDFEIDKTALRAKLSNLAVLVPPTFKRAFMKVAQDVKLDSMNHTPVEWGTLRASHVVMPPVGTGIETEITVAVGSSAAPYAIFVHEDLFAHHDAPGEAKFLENAALRKQQTLEQELVTILETLQ